jgi:dolichol-phosphate mannosyltransferase
VTLRHSCHSGSCRPIRNVVIPCYNEEEVIGETKKRLKLFCSELRGLDVELIFVDDGSRDRTRALLKGLPMPIRASS